LTLAPLNSSSKASWNGPAGGAEVAVGRGCVVLGATEAGSCVALELAVADFVVSAEDASALPPALGAGIVRATLGDTTSRPRTRVAISARDNETLAISHRDLRLPALYCRWSCESSAWSGRVT
jgi:hypothetical protein